MTTLTEKIIARALDEQQKNVFNIISGNFEISKQQTDELKKEVNELRHSIEYTENVFEDKVACMEEKLGHTESCIEEMHDANEAWEDCENELHTLFKESLGIEEEAVIERAHRMKTDKSEKKNTPRTIVCRILNYRGKVKILGNATKT